MSLTDYVTRNIRAVRLRQGLSQETVARKAGLSVSYISMLERGQRSPPFDTLEALAKALSVSPVGLLEEAPPRQQPKARRS
jgi:transcriptional regulator with XRE-family HTH domain